jgi:hypothetical protein
MVLRLPLYLAATATQQLAIHTWSLYYLHMRDICFSPRPGKIHFLQIYKEGGLKSLLHRGARTTMQTSVSR